MTALALGLSALIGVSLGLLGGGGSILALPVLVFVARISPGEAVGMSLALVGATSLVGGLLHARTGNVDPRLTALFGTLGLGGSYVGARLTRGLRPELLLAAFGLVMIVAGTFMLRDRPAGEPLPHRRPPAVGLVPVALGVGLLTGSLGVGGGFLLVPALVLFGRLSMPLAVGTSLLVIAMSSAAGFLGHLGGPGLDLTTTAGFTGAAMGGALAGFRLARHVSPGSLRAGFAALVLLLGGVLLVKSAAALLS